MIYYNSTWAEELLYQVNQSFILSYKQTTYMEKFVPPVVTISMCKQFIDNEMDSKLMMSSLTVQTDISYDSIEKRRKIGN